MSDSISEVISTLPPDKVAQAKAHLLGWTVGPNVRIETRWATTNPAEIRRHAAELVALAPDVILSIGDSTVPPLLQVTRTVPIVFPVVNDPLGILLPAAVGDPVFQARLAARFTGNVSSSLPAA